MVKNIRIEYAKEVPADSGRETFIKNQVQIWLKEYSEKFNNENGVVEITIGSDNRYNCSLTGISDKLKNEIDIYMHPLKRPYNF